MTTPSLSRTGSGAPRDARTDLPGAAAARAGGRPACDDQATELLLALGRLLRGHRHGDAMPRRLKAQFKDGLLAPRHVGALAVVALYGPLTVSELASREGLALSTASLLVTQLSQAGLVERNEDSEDRRRTVVSVAPAFRRESEAALESKLAPIRRALSRMGTRRATAMLEGLAILVEEITGSGGTSPGTDGVAPHGREEVSR
ncbi:MAG TPA: MarR family winged helix-turn-helix transcriptional regulator [Acidimicrobiales bacterium]|nr:MarR family winged helix-turn-helix transcriptional regulator [Acidimicrobiales bacterium]